MFFFLHEIIFLCFCCRKLWRSRCFISSLKLCSTTASSLSNVRKLLIVLSWEKSDLICWKLKDRVSSCCCCLCSVVSENCNSSSPVQLDVSWYLRNSHCYDEVVNLDVSQTSSSLVWTLNPTKVVQMCFIFGLKADFWINLDTCLWCLLCVCAGETRSELLHVTRGSTWRRKWILHGAHVSSNQLPAKQEP